MLIPIPTVDLAGAERLFREVLALDRRMLGDHDPKVPESMNNLAVALSAYGQREEAEGVFVIRDGWVKFVPVELGIAGEEHFEVLSGLDEGETVVSGPFRVLRELKDGEKVRSREDRKDRRRRDRPGAIPFGSARRRSPAARRGRWPRPAAHRQTGRSALDFR